MSFVTYGKALIAFFTPSCCSSYRAFRSDSLNEPGKNVYNQLGYKKYIATKNGKQLSCLSRYLFVSDSQQIIHSPYRAVVVSEINQLIKVIVSGSEANLPNVICQLNNSFRAVLPDASNTDFNVAVKNMVEHFKENVPERNNIKSKNRKYAVLIIGAGLLFTVSGYFLAPYLAAYFGLLLAVHAVKILGIAIAVLQAKAAVISGAVAASAAALIGNSLFAFTQREKEVEAADKIQSKAKSIGICRKVD